MRRKRFDRVRGWLVLVNVITAVAPVGCHRLAPRSLQSANGVGHLSSDQLRTAGLPTPRTEGVERLRGEFPPNAAALPTPPSDQESLPPGPPIEDPMAERLGRETGGRIRMQSRRPVNENPSPHEFARQDSRAIPPCDCLSPPHNRSTDLASEFTQADTFSMVEKMADSRERDVIPRVASLFESRTTPHGEAAGVPQETSPKTSGEPSEQVPGSTSAPWTRVCKVMCGPLKTVLRFGARSCPRSAAKIRHGRLWRNNSGPEPALEPPHSRFHPVPTGPVFAPRHDDQFPSHMLPIEPLPLPSSPVPADEPEFPRKHFQQENTDPPPAPEEVVPGGKETRRDWPPTTKRSSFHNWRVGRTPRQ